MDIVLLFPGQGSQQPGMGKDLFDSFPESRAAFDQVEDELSFPLRKLCFEGSADDLRLTHNAQVALFTNGVAAWAAIRSIAGSQVRAAAGHSVGEFAAFHCAGAIELAAAARLVRTRGKLMLEAGTTRPGAMAAILGTINVTIEELCETASQEGGVVVPANFNAPEQVVISGEIETVERAMRLALDAGAKRAIRLNVSGAFHSPLMEPSAPGLAQALAGTTFANPGYPVYSNVSEKACSRGTEARTLLARQLTSPVRWVGLIRNIEADYPGALCLELGPGTVLGGLVRRIAPSLRTAGCGTVADIAKLMETINT